MEEQQQQNIVIELNVGGVIHHTLLSTLTRDPHSQLTRWFTTGSTSTTSTTTTTTTTSNKQQTQILFKDKKDRYFIDRDGQLFYHILNYLRNNLQFSLLPTQNGLHLNHDLLEQLHQEAEFYGLKNLQYQIDEYGKRACCITLGYRGTFAFGRDGLTDVKFRKLSRILVAGRVFACREVFTDSLNDSRDPDKGNDDRYSSRFYLKHNNLEQAFEVLYGHGYVMVGSCASGTTAAFVGDNKPGQDTEEHKWQHYNEFVFAKK